MRTFSLMFDYFSSFEYTTTTLQLVRLNNSELKKWIPKIMYFVQTPHWRMRAFALKFVNWWLDMFKSDERVLLTIWYSKDCSGDTSPHPSGSTRHVIKLGKWRYKSSILLIKLEGPLEGADDILLSASAVLVCVSDESRFNSSLGALGDGDGVGSGVRALLLLNP